MNNALDKLKNQVRFVQMIIEKKLVVSGRRKVDIVADLRELNFMTIPKVVKDKNPERDEPDEDEQEAGELDSDYDYLLGMAIWNLTRERIDKLLQQAGDKEAELLALLEKSPIDLWNADLDAFLIEWEVRNLRIFFIRRFCNAVLE